MNCLHIVYAGVWYLIHRVKRTADADANADALYMCDWHATGFATENTYLERLTFIHNM